MAALRAANPTARVLVAVDAARFPQPLADWETQVGYPTVLIFSPVRVARIRFGLK